HREGREAGRHRIRNGHRGLLALPADRAGLRLRAAHDERGRADGWRAARARAPAAPGGPRHGPGPAAREPANDGREHRPRAEPPRLIARLLAVFAALALTLAAAGTYGVMSYS